jgi:hypothetical protein
LRVSTAVSTAFGGRLGRTLRSTVLGTTLVTACLGIFQAPSTQASMRSSSNPAARAQKLCKGIPRHDFAPLFSLAVIGGPNLGTAGSGDAATCGFVTAGSTYSKAGSSGTFVVLEIAIGGTAFYDQTKAEAKAHPLSGIGSMAIWNFMFPFPEIAAQKGDVTCVVTISGIPSKTTLAYTMSQGNPVVTTAAGKAYAEKMAPICKAVFTGK